MPNKDSGFEDEAENNDDQDPESLEPMSEEDVTENLSAEFIAERHRFLEWVFSNEELKNHRRRLVFNMNIPVDKHKLIEEVESRVYTYCMSGYGKKNELQNLWRDVENPENSTRKDPKQELLKFLKATNNSKCIDAISPDTIPNPNEEDVKAGGPKYIGRTDITGDIEILDQSSQDNDPQVHIVDSGMGNRIRECLRKDCRSKHLSTFIAIINLWEEGVDKPVDICLKIPGLTPKTYNDLQGSLREFLKKNVKFWLNDEEDPS